MTEPRGLLPLSFACGDRRKGGVLMVALLSLALSVCASAQGLVKPEGFDVRDRDRPNDKGGALIATWKKSPSDGPGVEYVLSVALKADGPWAEIARLDSTKWFQSDRPDLFGFSPDTKDWHYAEVLSIVDPENKDKKLPLTNELTFPTLYKLLGKLSPTRYPEISLQPYHFRLEMVRGDQRLLVGSATARPRRNLWDPSKNPVFIVMLILCALVLFMIRRARRVSNLFVRRIPGLDAIDEAIGRATEMGKPVLYLNGLYGMDSVSTIASTSILGRLARRIAQYDSQILVPCYDPVVMSVCQEVIKEAYIEAGRPDAFKEDSIFFLTNDQFSYVAAVDGIMLRDRPAANLYMGYYFAESLLLAETGSVTGAIQIAGTDSVTQLPFFIATCDYTLIGEELYAASAYLSREPLQLGSLKGQDAGKALLLILLVVGVVLSCFSLSDSEIAQYPSHYLKNWFTTF